MRLQNLLPNWILQFIQQPRTALPDIQAGLMMAVLVIPQSLGYAALAGLPPIMGLYAAIVPVLIYSWIGASSVSSIGPVAITAIMTASALSDYATGSLQYISLAITLALMVGAILLVGGLIRLGWIMQFVSRGVAAGFISGAAVLIILGQIKHLLGIPLNADSLINLAVSIYHSSKPIHALTAMIGLLTLGLLLISRYGERWVWAWLPRQWRSFGNRFFVIVLVVASIWASHRYNLPAYEVNVLQPLPTHLPTASLPSLSPTTLLTLLPSALLIALIAFVSSSTISAQQARLRGETYSANKELGGLGLANIASGIFGGFAVAGGISRTSLNLLVGANSPLASVICALGVLLILLFFGAYLTGLPYVVLASVIIISAIAMIDTKTLAQAWQHDKADAVCFVITFATAIVFGLNSGLVAGLLASFAAMIYRTHQVHIAVLGRVGNSEHFRNIERYQATTFEGLLLLRIDESLYFGNAQSVRANLLKLSDDSAICDIVLIMTAVNHVDLAAQEMLHDLNQHCQANNQRLHFAEVKGPVMDILKSSQVFANLSGQVFLSTNQAVQTLRPKS
ncbi:sulfate permease, SulP family [Moraxella cuniculi DSM 21768]|uniref:Sulfate permease, SulP family n=1 Tax=Moraxella cuniculi DSM 21768 TaxID=1122245 RepID=A0A1N7FRM7_9GAMM|nr:SulP family inorganic anion transporter [Moraxella cuniculi]OOS08370.1 sulfate transporter [Moraxella cuniculi]SIS02895.1 sulfate permease, SulP family [Moraxella cuniculi DSM 21768]